MYNNNNSNQSLLLDHGWVQVTLHVDVVCMCVCGCMLLTSKSSALSCVFKLHSEIHVTVYTSILARKMGKQVFFQVLLYWAQIAQRNGVHSSP